MIKMARIYDICGREIGTYNSRYTLTYKSILYSKEKDICPLFEMDIKRMVEARLAQTDCAWKKG